MLRLFNAIKKYLFKDTKYFFYYCFRYFQNNYKNNCKFYNESEIIKLLEGGGSIIRIGDGEIGLIHHLSISYQLYSDQIRKDFIKIIKSYNNKSNYILGIPIFVNYTNKELKKNNELHNYFRCWMPLKVTYELIFNKKVKYLDAHIFYRDGGFEKTILPYIVRKKIILVTNENNKKEILKSGFSKNIFKYVIAPDKNAYEQRGKIEKDIREIVEDAKEEKGNFVIIMSAGLSKTIIYKMSMDGYQILDIGKGLEGYYKKESLAHLI